MSDYHDRCDECGSYIVLYGGELVCGTCGLVHRPIFDTDIPAKAGNPIRSPQIFKTYNAVDNMILKIVVDGNFARSDIVRKVLAEMNVSKPHVYKRIIHLESKKIIKNIGYKMNVVRK